MATFKHISSKNADYGAAEAYLTFEHDEFTMKPTLDENGRLIPREDYRISSLNCGGEDFAVACMRANLRYEKNQKREDVKSHHYIISFDPRDGTDNGLTVDRAQELGEQFCKEHFPGHQALVCTHPDGHNHSGNIHVHIVINSLRIYEVPLLPYMDRPADTRAGCKHTYTVEVPYNYYILNVTLTNRPISSFVSELLTPEQLEMYRVYLQTSGNKPLVFGGGSADTSASEDLSGVQFVNGTRPGNTALVDIAKSQVGNVGGAPYWSWYGFDSRVAWCACFVSWCYGQAGLSEPRFAGCQSQGVPWFTSHGQWGARGYENIAPGDAIFFDWDLDGSADHVGIVIGTDGSRVYTVEGNSGDACKIRSYPLDYACIKGYGLMNWN